MKVVVSGFMLIEWVLYFFLSILLVMGVLEYVVGVRHHIVCMAEHSTMLAQLSAAHDACVRDVSTIDDTARWKELGPHALVWQCGTTSYSWTVEAGTLVRHEKRFDPHKKTWEGARKSVVARDIVEFYIEPLYAYEPAQSTKQRLVGMKVRIGGANIEKKMQVSSTVAFKNGRV
jgi:hypothetical protein